MFIAINDAKSEILGREGDVLECLNLKCMFLFENLRDNIEKKLSFHFITN